MSSREIKLDGGEIALLKTIGLSGTQMNGKLLLERISEVGNAEFLETLTGLIDQGYVVSNRVNIRLIEDVEHAFFRVNPAYARDLRDAVYPSRAREQRRTGRRERRG